ncbi:hypothetical protein GOEFS_051_00220, partial [Gordonia effusa NBRC 100432]
MAANVTEFASLADYKAFIDAKYRGALPHQCACALTNLGGLFGTGDDQGMESRRDRWLLITPDGDIDGVLTRRVPSAEEA